MNVSCLIQNICIILSIMHEPYNALIQSLALNICIISEHLLVTALVIETKGSTITAQRTMLSVGNSYL